MKKMITFALAAVVGFGLAACGGGGGTPGGDGGANSNQSNGGGQEDNQAADQADQAAQDDAPPANADTSTVEGLLAKAGLTLDAVKPDGFAEAVMDPNSDDTVVLYLTDKATNGVLGEAVVKPLVDKVLNATAAVADDGKYWSPYFGLGERVPLDLSEHDWNAYFQIIQWSYFRSGDCVTVTLAVVPAEEPEGQDLYDFEVTLAFLF